MNTKCSEWIAYIWKVIFYVDCVKVGANLLFLKDFIQEKALYLILYFQRNSVFKVFTLLLSYLLASYNTDWSIFLLCACVCVCVCVCACVRGVWLFRMDQKYVQSAKVENKSILWSLAFWSACFFHLLISVGYFHSFLVRAAVQSILYSLLNHALLCHH